MNIDQNAVVADDVELGDGASVGAFVVLGCDGPDQPGLRIGGGATIRSHSVVYRASSIGARFHIGHGALVREHTSIGDDVSIGSHTIIEHHVSIADGVRIHGNTFIPEHTELEAGCWIGPSVTVTNARYPNRSDTKNNLEGVQIGEGAVVGAAVVLLPGVVIGAGAIVGAGAVVVKDVEPGATIVGNPGRAT